MKVGDKVRIWITGRVELYDAEVLQVNDEGWPTRLQVPGWPVLKPGDFILRDPVH
jgi:hypothetical protein